MALAIVPFAAEHLDGAAVLLAARHRADRTHTPALPARFDDPAAARPVLADMVGRPATSGVVALRDGRAVGYLLGLGLLTPATSRAAAFLPPRTGLVPYAGHALDPGEATATLTGLYAALAPAWLAGGFFQHMVMVPAGDARLLGAWHALGFGCDSVTALRSASPVDARDTRLTIRRATGGDLDVVVHLAEELLRYQAGPPMWFPYLPETEAGERAYQTELAASPRAAQWLAYHDGRPVGLQDFEPAPDWLSPLLVPEGAVYLPHGYTAPDGRGTGVGTALLAAGLAWAREAGYTHCLLHFLSANVLGARFWLGHSFRPVEHRLSRHVDERIAWAHGRR